VRVGSASAQGDPPNPCASFLAPAVTPGLGESATPVAWLVVGILQRLHGFTTCVLFWLGYNDRGDGIGKSFEVRKKEYFLKDKSMTDAILHKKKDKVMLSIARDRPRLHFNCVYNLHGHVADAQLEPLVFLPGAVAALHDDVRAESSGRAHAVSTCPYTQ